MRQRLLGSVIRLWNSDCWTDSFVSLPDFPGRRVYNLVGWRGVRSLRNEISHANPCEPEIACCVVASDCHLNFPDQMGNQKHNQLRPQKMAASCAQKYAPSSLPAADPLSWISLDFQGWTPCMHIHVLPFGTTFLQRSANASLGGASQSAAPLCAGCVANRLRHSHLVVLPHHRTGRPPHPEGSRASLWRRGIAPQPLTVAGATSHPVGFVRGRLPRRNTFPLGRA